MKLVIIESRTCPYLDIAEILKEVPDTIVSGEAKGADSYAKEFFLIIKLSEKAHLWYATNSSLRIATRFWLYGMSNPKEQNTLWIRLSSAGKMSQYIIISQNKLLYFNHERR